MKAKTENFLKKLVTTVSPSGYEHEAAKVWKAEAAQFADEIKHDSHGNTDAVINPGGSPRIMFAGHCDEIGFLVTHIDSDGFLWIGPIGGWDPQIPQGQRVVIRGKTGHIPGVIGKKPIHLIKPADRDKVTPLDSLWVDIGAKDGKEAKKLVSVGDPLVIDSGYQRLLGDMAVARGFDDRAGAFVVLEAARLLSGMKPKAEIHAVATVQEEIGLRGARTAAYGIDPQVGIAVDVGFATDYPQMSELVKKEGEMKLGEGPIVTRGPNINTRLFELMIKAAKEAKIPLQIQAEPRGTGTDANAIQLNRAGVAAGLVSIPNRYMHTPCEMVNLRDLEACAKLLAVTSARITGRTNFIPY